jgi:hypothetical protein
MVCISNHDLGSALTEHDGTFRIAFTKEPFKKPGEWDVEKPQVYLEVYDESETFVQKTEKLTHPSSEEQQGEDKFEAVVIGSGFGGTIFSISLAKLKDGHVSNFMDPISFGV